MPNCVVKGCKNHSSKNIKKDGITFHTFPIRNNNVKEKWIEVIRVSRNEPSWNPTVRSVVCSAHFENDDLYCTKKGLRRVLRNGYPKHLPAAPDQSANIDINEPTTVYAHVPATPIESIIIDVDPIQPHTSQTHVPATPIESIIIDVDPIQPHTSQTNDPATPIESIIINVDPIQSHTSQAHVSAMTPILSMTPVPNMEEERESIFDTPRKHKLRQRIFRLENQQKQMKKKIKTLNQKVRRLKERNKSLMEMLDIKVAYDFEKPF